jgi:peptidoglycan/xylan/chitin deacetylase (PgdA/CDA1 family)
MSPGLPILTYHALDTSGSVIAIDPAWFAETLSVLHSEGFRAVDLADWIDAGRPRSDRAFALAFDDGLRSIRRAAGPLARYGFHATAFLVTGAMGGHNDWPGQPASTPRDPLLGWSELEELCAAGFRFSAHTRTHRRLDHLAEPCLEDELRGSRDDLEQRLGRPCRLLAYPYGPASPRVRRAAARHFAAAFGTRLDYATATEDLHAISRIDAYYLRTQRSLRRLVEGRWRRRLAVRRALRGVRAAGVEWMGESRRVLAAGGT